MNEAGFVVITAELPGNEIVEASIAVGELRRGMERDTALNFLRQLGGASGVHPAGMAGHTAMAGSPAAGAASLGRRGAAEAAR